MNIKRLLYFFILANVFVFCFTITSYAAIEADYFLIGDTNGNVYGRDSSNSTNNEVTIANNPGTIFNFGIEADSSKLYTSGIFDTNNQNPVVRVFNKATMQEILPSLPLPVDNVTGETFFGYRLALRESTGELFAASARLFGLGGITGIVNVLTGQMLLENTSVRSLTPSEDITLVNQDQQSVTGPGLYFTSDEGGPSVGAVLFDNPSTNFTLNWASLPGVPQIGHAESIQMDEINRTLLVTASPGPATTAPYLFTIDVDDPNSPVALFNTIGNPPTFTSTISGGLEGAPIISHGGITFTKEGNFLLAAFYQAFDNLVPQAYVFALSHTGSNFTLVYSDLFGDLMKFNPNSITPGYSFSGFPDIEDDGNVIPELPQNIMGVFGFLMGALLLWMRKKSAASL